jgi:hypothetical protein
VFWKYHCHPVEYRIQNNEYRIRNTEYRIQNTYNHVHKTTHGPLIVTALYVMLLMQENPLNPLLGQMGEGWALEISTI